LVIIDKYTETIKYLLEKRLKSFELPLHPHFIKN